MICDIDHFKNINDQYGHQVGDEVLVEIATSLCKCLRASDVYARWDSGEFIILLPQTEQRDASLVAEKLRQCIESTETGHDFKIAASFGVSHFNEDGDILPLVKRADDALYQAKHEGRNRVHIYE